EGVLVEKILRLTDQPGHIRTIRQDRRGGDAAVGLVEAALRLLAGEVVALRAEGGVWLEHTGVPGVQNVRRADPPGGDVLIGGEVRRGGRAALPIEPGDLAQDLPLRLR